MKKYYPLIGFIILGLSLSLVGPFTQPKPTSMITIATTQQLNQIIRSLKAKNSNNNYTGDFGPVRSEMAMEAKDSQEYTGTNNQISGVDEADVIKTDGTYIYQLVDNTLKIFLAYPVESAQLITTIDLSKEYDAYFSQLLIQDNQLILLGQSGFWLWGFYPMPIFDEPIVEDGEQSSESAPDQTDDQDDQSAQDSRIMPIFDRPLTQHILILDMSDRSAPTVTKRFDIEGSTLAFRKIDNQMILVSQKYNNHYLARSELATYEELLPNRKIDDKELTARLEEIVIIDEPENLDMMSIIKISLDDYSMTDTHLLGAGQSVLLTPERLFISQTTYQESSVSQTQTTFYQLSFQNSIQLLNSVTVDGYMINSFAMDYYNNHLRTALTISNWNNNEFFSTNRLVIFNSDLVQVSSIENLAIEETIYSARFVGDRGYIVTFKQVDPFFVFDLSNPNNPKVLGELKIPGFSTYLHPVSDHLVLGFGREVDVVNETFGEVLRIGAIKLSLFDVSLGINPLEIATLAIGDSNSYSEALYEHKSLMVNAPKNLYGFGISAWTFNETTYETSFKNTAMIVEVLDGEFVERLAYNIESSSKETYDYIQRIIMIDDMVYIITNQFVHVVDLLTSDVVTIIQ